MEERLWHKSYAPGVKKSLDYEKLTLSQALTRSSEAFPEKTALNYMGKRITYRQLNELANRFARALRELGIRPGDKVAVCLPNIPQVIIANLAILRIGAVAVQNNPLYTERELEYQLNDSDSKMVITLTLLIPRMEKIRQHTQIEKIIGCHINTFLPFPKKQFFPFVKKDMYRKVAPNKVVRVFEDLIAEFPPEPVEEEGQWNDLAALMYTGGTTGVSKGVMLSHANLSSVVQQFVSWFPDLNAGEERLVGNFPVFHIAGTLDVTASNHQLSVAGTWSDTGSFMEHTGLVVFLGTGNTGAETFSNVQLNGGTRTASGNWTVTGSLTLTAGTFTPGNLHTKSPATGMILRLQCRLLRGVFN